MDANDVRSILLKRTASANYAHGHSNT